MTQPPSIKEHPKFEQVKSFLRKGKHSTRFVAEKLGINRIEVCIMKRVIAEDGNK